MTSESFRKEVAERLDAVVKSLEPRASVAFPSCLSAEERKYVHHLAEQFGLKHESKGRGDARFISVSKDPGKVRESLALGGPSAVLAAGGVGDSRTSPGRARGRRR
ncbi:unnamed protein product [Durusdinium trenchii]|uniref:R3H domain-containing protein n=1 Tax=Durusdinium trenchii TaxID=1381693 RepID=A0ABP0LTB7_9DINO